MTDTPGITLLPYSYLVGQEAVRRALEIAYAAPGLGGLLLSGERGTAKSTAVRSFAMMAYGRLPVTLPINATDDRVLGGLRVDALLEGRSEAEPGLLERAGESGVLYVDEVNLLDDHVVNLILDVVATGLLVVQREGLDRPEVPVSFTLIGTMNPEEGWLRPQLLDRFGLVVPVEAEAEAAVRRNILMTVLRFEEERTWDRSPWLEAGRERDREQRERLVKAREAVKDVVLSDEAYSACADIAAAFELVGHRGEVVMAQAARAAAALDGRTSVVAGDVQDVAPYAIMHRRPQSAYGEDIGWNDQDAQMLDRVCAGG